ncbi:MAG: PH domain-containing protein [Phycisphaerales bacterium]|nr:PH domain-containing protein [Phycisphaerales bacterium]
MVCETQERISDVRLELSPRVVASVEGAGAAPVEALPIAADYLDQGEIVLLAIKPSPWFVLFDSTRWLMVGAALLVLSALPSLRLADLSGESVAQLGAVVIAGRLGIAFLRWASRFYVLTNRRVMRLRGVFRPDILACPLVAIRNTRVHRRLHERATALGTIRFFFEDSSTTEHDWREIARSDSIHAQVRRAIERAIDSQPHI